MLPAILLIPVAFIAGAWLFGASKMLQNKNAPTPTPAATPKATPQADISNQLAEAAQKAAEALGIPSANTKVDGKGTGLLPPPSATTSPAQQAAVIVQQNDPLAQVAAAARDMQFAIEAALSTPEGDRTPEQLALLEAMTRI